MKVAFDLTPLGSGRFYPRSRTGIFRVCAELLTALQARSDIELLPVAVQCRGEAEDEVRRLELPLRLHRSAWDRALYPWLTRLFVPKDLPVTQALSDGRRKGLRTFVQLLELAGGSPRAVGKHAAICHSPYLSPTQVGWLAAQAAPRVVTVHDLLPLTHPEFFPGGDDKLLAKIVADVQAGAFAHCVSEYTRSELVRLVPEARQRSFVAPLAASRQRFAPPGAAAVQAVRQQLGVHSEYLLCVGTLDPRKNLVTALEAMDQVLRQRPGLQLVVVGATARHAPAWDRLFAPFPQVRAATLFTGYLPDGLLPALYAGAGLVLFPSLAEGFGLPALEAMQSGGALLCSNATSLPEVVGTGGVLLDPRDVAAWRDAILHLMDAPAERDALALRGLTQSGRYSWSTTAEAVVEAYRRIVDRGSLV
jgi:glycosyltransferase involved in cell wall biosynthesis